MKASPLQVGQVGEITAQETSDFLMYKEKPG